MSRQSALEAFLARLYVDPALLREFLASPRVIAERAGLEAAAVDAVVAIDRVGLELAAASFARKRAGKAHGKPRSRWWPHRLA